jgi:hypothetical protein
MRLPQNEIPGRLQALLAVVAVAIKNPATVNSCVFNAYPAAARKNATSYPRVGNNECPAIDHCEAFDALIARARTVSTSQESGPPVPWQWLWRGRGVLLPPRLA